MTDEQKAGLYSWFPTRMPPTGAAKIAKLLKDIEAVYGAKTWGAAGFCWGGKVIALTSGEDTPWKATAMAHPGQMDAADAENISIPTCLLASEEEGEEVVAEWMGKLRGEKYSERFGEMLHGFMSARGDLEDVHVKGEYEKGYRIFLEWFAKHL